MAPLVAEGNLDWASLWIVRCARLARVPMAAELQTRRRGLAEGLEMATVRPVPTRAEGRVVPVMSSRE